MQTNQILIFEFNRLTSFVQNEFEELFQIEDISRTTQPIVNENITCTKCTKWEEGAKRPNKVSAVMRSKIEIFDSYFDKMCLIDSPNYKVKRAIVLVILE